MSEVKRIDYIGFTFNGIHSSELGIVRVSDGSRFNENLLPTIQDKTTQVPGEDGMYHFGSYYTQKQFNISYAFDALTEEQLARLQSLFGDKKIHDLIFDECPYKVYQAKVTGTAQIKYLPFSEGEKNRIYKGEGSVQFTAYSPYARSVKKFLNDEYYKNWNNIQEWRDAANLLENQEDFDIKNGNKIKLYNPGVKETDFTLTLHFNADNIIPAGAINIGADKQLYFSKMNRQGDDTHIKINTKLNLIEGYNQNGKTGKVYNRHITKGTFFKIPKTTNTEFPKELVIENSNSLADCVDGIEYDYFYF